MATRKKRSKAKRTTKPKRIDEFRSGDYNKLPRAEDIADCLDNLLVELIESRRADVNALNRIIKQCDFRRSTLPEPVIDALMVAVDDQIQEASSELYDPDNEYELEDYLTTIKVIADWAGVDASSVLESGENRLIDLREEELDLSSATFPTGPTSESDDFDDDALKSMFATLAAK